MHIRLAPLSIPFLLAAALPAQVPVDWAAFCAFKDANAAQDLGGVVMFNPRSQGTQFSVIQGLGADLTGAGSTGVTQGASAILIRNTDGAIVVGEHTPNSEPTVDIHLITLNGNMVVNDQAFPIGAPDPNRFSSIDQMAWMPDGNVLFSYRGVLGQGLAAQGFGVLDLQTGAVTPVMLPFFPFGTLNAMTLDWTGSKIYFGVFGLGSNPTSSRILEVPVSGGIPVSRGFFVGSVLNLAVDVNDDILIGMSVANNPGLLRLPPAGGATTAISTTMNNVNALTVDRVTGDYLMFGEDSMTPGGWRVDPTGTTTTQIYGQMLPPPGVGTGVPSGIAMRDSVSYYGAPQFGQNTYRWASHPSPMNAGFPTIGNLNFGVAASSTPGAAIGAMGLSLGRANLQLPLGFTAWIDPATIGASILLPPATSVFVPVPIPPNPSLAGINVFAQVIYLEGSSFPTTQGLQISIF